MVQYYQDLWNVAAYKAEVDFDTYLDTCSVAKGEEAEVPEAYSAWAERSSA